MRFSVFLKGALPALWKTIKHSTGRDPRVRMPPYLSLVGVLGALAATKTKRNDWTASLSRYTVDRWIDYSKNGEFDSSNVTRLSCHSITPGTSRNSPVLVVSDANFATSGDNTQPTI